MKPNNRQNLPTPPFNPPKHTPISLIPQHPHNRAHTCAPQQTAFLPEQQIIEEELLNHPSNISMSSIRKTQTSEKKTSQT